jgi:hypothetical protein
MSVARFVRHELMTGDVPAAAAERRIVELGGTLTMGARQVAGGAWIAGARSAGRGHRRHVDGEVTR